jgi:hypothetical protein
MPWNKIRISEEKWVKLQPFLKSRGYLLRRRYQPEWKPGKKEKETDETTLEVSAREVTLDKIGYPYTGRPSACSGCGARI